MRDTEAHDIGSHPDLDRWLAYRGGDLGRDDEETLRDHLVDCRSCSALVLDLEAFADRSAGSPAVASPEGARPAAVSDFEQAAVWRSLRPRLRPRRWYVPASLAAAFLAAIVGGGLWQQRELTGLRHELAELSRPQANAPIYDLYPRAALRGEASAGPTLEVPAAAPTFTVILNGAEPAEPGVCRAAILDRERRPALEVEGLVQDELGVFTFALPRDALAAGDYVVRLWGPGDGGELIAEYPLRVVHP